MTKLAGLKSATEMRKTIEKYIKERNFKVSNANTMTTSGTNAVDYTQGNYPLGGNTTIHQPAVWDGQGYVAYNEHTLRIFTFAMASAIKALDLEDEDKWNTAWELLTLIKDAFPFVNFDELIERAHPHAAAMRALADLGEN